MLIDDIAAYAVAERTRPLPDEAIHAAKRCVIDWLAATAPGALVMPATGLVVALAEDLDRGRARLFPSGRLASLRTAALINAAASHTVEFDDIFRDAIYHPGTPTVAAALAAAETHGASGEAFLRAVIVGYEISTRIGVTMGRGHYKYWHNTATIGTFGATAAVASILGLDERSFGHAITTAVSFAAGLQQAFRSDSMTKPMHGGHAADAGAMAAMIAGAEVTGARDMLEGEVGFGVAMGDDPDWNQATDGLGERYNITRMTVKNHGCCGHTFAAIDGMLALREAHALKPADIDKIKVGGYSATVNVCGSKAHSTPFEGKFSLAYVLAQALNHGSVRLDAFTPDRLNDPVTHALVEKVGLTIDPEIDAMFPGQRAANLEVVTIDGRVLKFHQPTRKGDPDLPLTDDDLNGKFMELTAPVTGEAAATALLDASWRLDALTSAAELPFGGSGGALRGAAG